MLLAVHRWEVSYSDVLGKVIREINLFNRGLSQEVSQVAPPLICLWVKPNVRGSWNFILVGKVEAARNKSLLRVPHELATVVLSVERPVNIL